MPAFSPDGNQVAFVNWDAENSGIYTTLIDGERPLRLTDNPTDCFPVWSPDGRQVAFSRHGDTSSLYMVSALGGAPHRIYDGKAASFTNWSWSPDGKKIAFAEGERSHTHIALLSLADSVSRSLTSPPAQNWDAWPVFSPDGSLVAFSRGAGIADGSSELYVVSPSGGEPRRLTFQSGTVEGMAWTPDSREIVYSSPRNGLFTLWRILATGGHHSPLPESAPARPTPALPQRAIAWPTSKRSGVAVLDDSICRTPNICGAHLSN